MTGTPAAEAPAESQRGAFTEGSSYPRAKRGITHAKRHLEANDRWCTRLLMMIRIDRIDFLVKIGFPFFFLIYCFIGRIAQYLSHWLGGRSIA